MEWYAGLWEMRVRKEECLKGWGAKWASDEGIKFPTRLVADWIKERGEELAAIS